MLWFYRYLKLQLLHNQRQRIHSNVQNIAQAGYHGNGYNTTTRKIQVIHPGTAKFVVCGLSTHGKIILPIGYVEKSVFVICFHKTRYMFYNTFITCAVNVFFTEKRKHCSTQCDVGVRLMDWLNFITQGWRFRPECLSGNLSLTQLQHNQTVQQNLVTIKHWN